MAWPDAGSVSVHPMRGGLRIVWRTDSSGIASRGDILVVGSIQAWSAAPTGSGTVELRLYDRWDCDMLAGLLTAVACGTPSSGAIYWDLGADRRRPVLTGGPHTFRAVHSAGASAAGVLDLILGPEV